MLRSLAVSLGKNEGGDLSFTFSLNPVSLVGCFLLGFKVAGQSPLGRKQGAAIQRELSAIGQLAMQGWRWRRSLEAFSASRDAGDGPVVSSWVCQSEWQPWHTSW